MKVRPLRSRDGRYLRKLVPTPEGQACWLIWSRRWKMWHRCGSEGGYTSDITRAGLFPFSKASAYHDGIRNEAFHVSEKVDLITMQISDVRSMLGVAA